MGRLWTEALEVTDGLKQEAWLDWIHSALRLWMEALEVTGGLKQEKALAD